MAAPENENPNPEKHTHSEDCGTIPGFESFGEREYELSTMAIRAVNDKMGYLLPNIVTTELEGRDPEQIPLPAEFVAAPMNAPEEYDNLISLGTYAGAKAMAMALIAMGAVKENVLVENQPRRDTLSDLLARITGGANVAVFEVGQDEKGETKVRPVDGSALAELFDPKVHEKESPVDRTPNVLPYGVQEETAGEVARMLGTDDDDPREGFAGAP